MSNFYNLKDFAKNLVNLQIEALEKLSISIDQNFELLVSKLSSCKGKLVFSSLGKSFLISKKISSTLSSLGKPSIAIHSTDLLHGELGFISSEDLVILVSHSGETEEIIRVAESLLKLNLPFISITSNKQSRLNTLSKFSYLYPNEPEFSINGLAPTTSSTLLLVLGDLLAISIEKVTDFGIKEFSKFHPDGAIGKSNLTLVKDLMVTINDLPLIYQDSNLETLIEIINKYKFGIAYMVDEHNSLLGIITDGDLRRARILFNKNKFTDLSQILNKNPKYVFEDAVMLDANLIMISNNLLISNLPVLSKNNKLLGAITLNSFIQNGIKIIKK